MAKEAVVAAAKEAAAVVAKEVAKELVAKEVAKELVAEELVAVVAKEAAAMHPDCMVVPPRQRPPVVPQEPADDPCSQDVPCAGEEAF